MPEAGEEGKSGPGPVGAAIVSGWLLARGLANGWRRVSGTRGFEVVMETTAPENVGTLPGGVVARRAGVVKLHASRWGQLRPLCGGGEAALLAGTQVPWTRETAGPRCTDCLTAAPLTGSTR